MAVEYKVDTFVPKISGCGGTDNGWDQERCSQFQKFLNQYASDNWKLHSSEYREVSMSTKSCGGSKGAWLVCIFERHS
jgi:Domain of unknown function (DUF4177)